MMETYLNLSGESGVRMYEIGPDFITVQFKDGACYKYTYASAGRENIEHMKVLARAGRGLHSFIMKNVKDDYESKW